MDERVLLDITKAAAVKQIPLTSDKFLIGRSLQNDYVISNTDVSRTHCILEKRNNEWSLLDESTNGTMLNGRMLDKTRRYKLALNDVITFGDVHFMFRMPSEIIETSISNANIDLTGGEVFHIVGDMVDDVQAFQSDLELPRSNTFATVPSPASVEPSVNNQNIGCNNAPADADASEQQQQPNSGTVELAKCLEFADDELQCSICTELFIQAVTLSCSHSFCKYCIASWQKKNSLCPICRAKITAQCQTRVLDTFIEKLQNSNEELKKRRLAVIAQREADAGPPPEVASSSSGTSNLANPRRRPASGPIEVSSEEDSSDEGDMVHSSGLDNMSNYSGSDWERDYYDDHWFEYNGLPGHYYGGYGHCFLCGQRGHWANGCPNK